MSKHKKRPFANTLELPFGGADSHAHLDSEEFRNCLADVMDRARAAGLASVGQVYLSPEAWEKGKTLFAPYPELFFLLGIHPCDALKWTDETEKRLREAFLSDETLRAVGEIGLDFYWRDCPHDIQKDVFRKQLRLSIDLDKPVVIHSRDAAEETIRILEEEGFVGRALLWHCLSSDAMEYLTKIIANGWHVSIPGPYTYRSSQIYDEAVATIPHDRIMVETDCPYLAPEPWRGKINEPSFSAFTAVHIAHVLHMDPKDFWLLCGRNTRKFFGLPECC
ncbi:MAG: TatD family hydrolase [Desulfovibrionaceae bacterium]|nr:TatD family hydrolase [Desulfovibrionaceae bacterium]